MGKYLENRTGDSHEKRLLFPCAKRKRRDLHFPSKNKHRGFITFLKFSPKATFKRFLWTNLLKMRKNSGKIKAVEKCSVINLLGNSPNGVVSI
jgi:hypothetical protein